MDSSMASSSTANESSASSSSSFDSSGIRREYQVFLSCRGEDTRNNFTDQLYIALNDRGIYTFRYVVGHERGEDISSVLEAIERSSVSIIVLSKNYASSKWCLEELAKILECMATKKQKVFPVFYKVHPSDIREQRGDFETAFHKHEEDCKGDLDKVQRWRLALTQVSTLCGWHLQESRSEAEFIEQIVDTISISFKPTKNNWRRVGKLFVSQEEIAMGSNGTIVYEGIHEGRTAAVKRLLLSHHDDVAFNEIQNLIASDRHPNIVRWYGKEIDRDFVYLSLELCSCNLDDLIQMNSDSSHNSSLDEGQDTKAMTKRELRLDSVKHLSLWKANGHPSPLLLNLMKDMVSGLVHLHELRIVHRDLKPQNVLISNLYDTSHERSLCAKLSDMGISKCLPTDTSSLGHHATGCGSSGWQAPEQLRKERQTRAVDLFSLGCVLYFCFTGGKHPFGNYHERDSNILQNQMNLFSRECIPEAEDLISCLLNHEPKLRPSAFQVLHHPLFWSSDMRLSFVRDTSDMVELECKKTDSALLKALENTASVAQCTKWNEMLDDIFIQNIEHHKRRKSYRFDSVQDLLRVMRNKFSHYGELPKEIKELVGPVPEGFDGYFATRFPRLFIEVYKVVCRYCRKEPCFLKYFKDSTEDSGATVATETTDPATVPGTSY